MSVFSQISHDGFYRVSNLKTGRYVYVRDNTGSLNVQTTSADMGALELWKDHNRTLSDPGSVIYIQKKGTNSSVGDYYDLQSQGTGVYSIIKYYVYADYSRGSYQVYAEGKYLSDENSGKADDGAMGTTNTGNYRRWLVTEINGEDEYFGITPSIVSGERYFQPFFADFGFTLKGDGMKVWLVSQVTADGAVIVPFNGTVVPARTPVIIECSHAQVSDNKLDLVRNYSSLNQTNILKGVYFNNPYRHKSADARKVYDKNTMRVLGIMSDGRLGYVLSKEPVDSKTNKQYLAANQSYLVVGQDIPDEIPLLTESEYQAILDERIQAKVPLVSQGKLSEVYSLSGNYLGNLTETEISQLPSGIYFINRRKMVIP